MTVKDDYIQKHFLVMHRFVELILPDAINAAMSKESKDLSEDNIRSIIVKLEKAYARRFQETRKWGIEDKETIDDFAKKQSRKHYYIKRKDDSSPSIIRSKHSQTKEGKTIDRLLSIKPFSAYLHYLKKVKI